MKKGRLLVLGLMCGMMLPLSTQAYEDGIYTGLVDENGNEVKTVIFGGNDTFSGVQLTIKMTDQTGNYYWGFNKNTDNSVWDDDSSTGTGTYMSGDGKMHGGTYGAIRNNLWGGGGDTYENGFNPNPTNFTERQGPCDSGYHVPSRGERNALVIAWCNIDTGCNARYGISGGVEGDFQKAGNWTSGNNLIYTNTSKYGLGAKFKDEFNMSYTYFWSSSPYSGRTNLSWYLLLYQTDISPDSTYNRNIGYHVRCLKNSIVAPAPQTFTLTFDSQGGSKVDTGIAEENTSRTRPDDPTKSGYIFVDWYTSTGYDTVFDFTTLATVDLTVYAKWGCETGYKDNGTECVLNKDIVIEATSTAANQTLKINKYFANAYTVDWGDGSPVQDLTGDIVHPYSIASGYTITLSLSGADRWIFQSIYKPLVPTDGTTATGVKIVSMPSLAEGFGNDATNPGGNFFSSFNQDGALTSLPHGSFDTSNVTTAGSAFFYNFNNNGLLTSLPEGSFKTENITAVASSFFGYFNHSGNLTSLPEGSFKTENIVTIDWGDFFSSFNQNGALKSLPGGSFRLATGLSNVRLGFFSSFNQNGALTSLSTGSFNTENITTVGADFFRSFNQNGALTSLSTGSFNTENITTVEKYFFSSFNQNGALESLPEGSFRFGTGITLVQIDFFSSFNAGGALTSLSTGSFNTENITTVRDDFFRGFNAGGALESLPEGSFNISNITFVGYRFFSYFNAYGALEGLPEGSFRFATGLTRGDHYFFNSFNESGALESLPARSFNLSNITSAAGEFFAAFNQSGSLKTLPAGSFDTSNIERANDDYFAYFNAGGALKSLPEGSFKFSPSFGGEFSFPSYYFHMFNAYGALESLPDGSFDASNVRYAGYPHFIQFNYEGHITTLPDSFKLSPAGGYQEAFYSPNYTLNKKVSDLVTGLSVPYDGRYTFSDNQPGRCGVHENWLVTTADACHIRYDANGGNGSMTGGYTANTTGVEVGSGITPPTREGYSFSGWLDASGNKVDEILFPEMDGLTLYANWEKNTPSGGSSGGGGGGGGGSSSSTTGDIPNQTGSGVNSLTGSQNEKPTSGTKVNEPEGTGKNMDGQTGNEDNTSTDSQTDNKTYSTEFQQAYEFAKGNGITTMPTIQKANMEGKLTRIAMAKMLSQYAMNVLGQKPANIVTPKFNDVTDKQNSDYDDGVTLAYQLGIMGQNMPGNNFRPNDEVTRAEFATALSRMAYNTSDGEYKSTSKYYIHHMEKLVNEGIITNDDPNMKELRGYVMIMLMRSTK